MTLLFVASMVGGPELTPVFICHPETLRLLRIVLNLLCLHCTSGATESGWQPICFQHD